MYVKPISVIVQ